MICAVSFSFAVYLEYSGVVEGLELFFFVFQD